MGDTPARTPAGNGGGASGMLDSFNADHIQLVLTLVALGVWTYLTQGGYTLDHFVAFVNSDGGHVQYWPLGGLFVTLHVFKTAASTDSSGFWAGSFVRTVIACYSGWILVDLLNGNEQRILTDESHVFLAFVAWYFTQHNLPGSDINLWNKVTEMIPTDKFDYNVLFDIASLIWSTQFICSTVENATSTASSTVGFSIFTPLFFGVAAGCASDFFPLNKGIDVSACSDRLYSSLLISFYIASDGLRTIPGVGEAASGIFTQAEDYVGGGHTNFVLAVVLVCKLIGGLLEINPFTTVTSRVSSLLNF